jgi:hypothetical protein
VPFGGTVLASVAGEQPRGLQFMRIPAASPWECNVWRRRTSTQTRHWAANRVRLQLSMTSVEPKDNGRLLIKGNAILEIENSQTPALVAETLTLVVP